MPETLTPTKTRFYKTTYTIEVLTTDENLAHLNLEDIAYQCTHGECSGEVKDEFLVELSRENMLEALEEQGTDPSFLLGDE